MSDEKVWGDGHLARFGPGGCHRVGQGAEEARRPLAGHRSVQAQPRLGLDREQDGHRQGRDGGRARGDRLPRTRAGVLREHGLVLQPSGVQADDRAAQRGGAVDIDRRPAAGQGVARVPRQEARDAKGTQRLRLTTAFPKVIRYRLDAPALLFARR